MDFLNHPSPHDPARHADLRSFEISPRFRQSLIDRIERLERDADTDEATAMRLEDGDHLERHLRLVAAQRAEALRMRVFLDRSKTRLPRPLISL